MWPQKNCSLLVYQTQVKALRRQTDLQSWNLTSCRESCCRREHVGCCSESLEPNKKTEYTWFKISAPIVCTDSNLRHSWNHLPQWTCSVPREQKGCQSTWMNHSNPQQKPISWSEERQRTECWLCATAQMHHRKKIHQALRRERKRARPSAFTWEQRHVSWILCVVQA